MSDVYIAEPLHFNCFPCQAAASTLTPEETAETDMVMLHLHSVEDILKGLCFAHRRAVEDTVKKMRGAK